MARAPRVIRPVTEITEEQPDLFEKPADAETVTVTVTEVQPEPEPEPVLSPRTLAEIARGMASFTE